MAKHTEGAVHLTSLSLDLTQFNENIQQIQNSTAEVADVAVQNLSKIKEALNVPTEQMRLSVDTTQLTQDIDKAQSSITSLGNTYQTVSKEIQANPLFTESSIGKIIKDLGITVDKNIQDAERRLSDFFKFIKEYDKVSFSASGGKLFQAIVTSSNEAGQSMRKVIDLTKEVTEQSVNSAVTISDNAEKRTAEIERQNAAIEKANDRLANSLNKIISQYESLAKQVNKSNLEDIVKQDFLTQISNAQTGIKGLQEEIRGLSQIAPKDFMEKSFESLDINLKNITSEFDKAKKEQAEFLTDTKRAEILSRSYNQLEKQIAGLVSTMAKANIQTPQAEGDLLEARQLAQAITEKAEAMRNASTAEKEEEQTLRALANEVDRLIVSFSNSKTAVADYKNALAPIKETAENAVSSLKTLEKTAVFKTSKDKVAALRAEYEEFLNRLKNTNIGVDVAEKELSDLQKQFDELESTVKRGNGTLENWVNKITESAKWQIANSALNLLQQSFGQLTTTIIDTEDAVIELRRVLNDKSLVDSEMTQTLYDIAYEFGQTFDNVQEVALKFAQTGKTWEETVAATRATMLGLNTAELEVSTATEGLIAVMAQFNVEADDLEKVIDKINITADNFPVTSEKIVAALQRAGGTARAFGLTLDETIGVITALSKATGRAGEAIGTAMNSLITFSMKSSSLDKFSEFLGQDVSNFDVLELWQALAEEINNGNESLATMMSTSEEFNSLMDEELATSIGLTEEFTKAQEEANKMTAEGKDIYSTVGTYRQNYFIALLNNIATATEAIEGMSGAVGYSMQENEVAMESFSKKWNQLIDSAKELAIQFGESGFLDSMKLLVDISSSVLSLTKNIGGLNTVLLVTSGIILKVKQQKVIDWLTKTSGLFRTGADAISIYNGYLATGATRSAAFAAATNLLKLSMGDVLAIAGLAVTGVSMAINAYQNWQEEIKKARDEAIQLGKESVQQLDELGDLYLKYSKAKELGDDDALTSARKELVEYLGVELHDLEILVERNKDVVKGYEDIDAAIQTLLKDKYALEVTQIQEGYDNLLEKMGEVEGKAADIMQAYNVQDPVYNYLKDTQASWELFLDSMDKELTTDNVEIYYKVLQKALADVETKFTSTELAANDFYNSMSSRKDDLEAWVLELAKMAEQEGLVSQGFEAWVESLIEGEESLEGASTSTENFAMSLEEIEGTIDSLNKKMDDFQSSVKSVESIITQYNQTGVMTADMLQTLIGLAPEYIDLIDINSGSLSLNQEKLENLMKVNDNYMVQMAAMKIAKEYEALSTELQQEKYDNLTAAEIQNMITTNALGGEIYQLAMQLYSGQINADQFKKAIQQAGEKSGLAANKVSVLTQSMADLASNMSGVINLAGMFPNLSLNASVKVNGKTIEEWEKDRQRGIISEATFQKYLEQSRNMAVSTPSSGTKTWFPSSTTKTGGGGAGGNADKFKAEKDALSDLLEVYEHSILLIEHNEKDSAKAGKEIAAIYRKMQDEVHAQAERYRAAGVSENDELIRNLQKSWLGYQDKIEEVLHGIYEETVAAHEQAINYLEHQYDSAEQRLDYSFMGENLKKQLDYQVKIQREAERELERLAKLGMDANSEAAQDVIDTWYDAEKSIRDISQKIQESILQPYEDFIDLADKFDIWEYMDFTKVDYLRMELQEVNNMLANGTMSLKEYNAQLKQLSYAIYDAQKELFDKQKADVEAAKDEVVKGYKSDIDSLKDQKEQIEDYYRTVIDGYNAEIDAWEDRKDKVNEYYDTLIDNLNDVQAANERINAQVDYYNERQKIITNLEQAQARSGVEWREKEMEYQQSLIDLDEEWNRTQKEWDIQDQIDMLNELKERALADIDLSIQAIRATIESAEQAKTAAIESIEAEIAGIEEAITATEQKAEEEIALIDEQFKMLSQTIAEAIKNGTADGVANTQAEIDKALVDGTNAMLSFIDSTNQTFTQTSQETANTVYGIYDTSFITPMYGEINNIASHMQTAMTEGASGAAQAALTQFRNSFITPLKNEMASILSQSEKAKQTIATTTPQTSTITTGTSGKFVKPNYDLLKSHQQMVDWAKTSPIVYINNNNLSRESGAKRNETQIVQSILNSH